MRQTLGTLCLLLAALPVQAQFRSVTQHFADPTVWISASYGAVTWSPPTEGYIGRDDLASDFSVTVSALPWMLRGGVQISERLKLALDFSGMSLSRPSGSTDSDGQDVRARTASNGEVEVGPYTPLTFRSLYAMGGPIASSRWFMAGAAVGPAVTWGTREREVRTPCAPADFCTLRRTDEESSYFNPGLAGSVQGFVRLDGRVWLGGETMLVANAASTHLATRFALRIDLRRPDR